MAPLFRIVQGHDSPLIEQLRHVRISGHASGMSPETEAFIEQLTELRFHIVTADAYRGITARR